jgi:hypothetical protein
VSENERNDDEDSKRLRRSIYIEDALIIASIAVLFWLGVFHRTRPWAQLALAGVALIMLIVMVRRARRVRRAFKGRQEDEEDVDRL